MSILLEELGIDYEIHAVDVARDQKFASDSFAISPDTRIPDIVDRETGLTLMDSGAILWHLAETHGHFLPADAMGRIGVMEWPMWQMGGLGPMLGQAHHFLKYNRGKAPYAEECFGREARRLYGVLNIRLEGRDFITDTYSIADMAAWPRISRFEWHEIDLADLPNVRDWYRRTLDRPAVQRSHQIPKDVGPIPPG